LLATLAWLKYTDLAGHWLEQRTAPVRSKCLDLTGAVRCSSQWPAKSVYFSHASVANNNNNNNRQWATSRKGVL